MDIPLLFYRPLTIIFNADNIINMSYIDDINIAEQAELITPHALKQALPLSDSVIKTIDSGRSTVMDILNRKDGRLFVVVGPCSIHDTKAAMEYAHKLRALAEEVSDSLYLIMRVYFEKPRTTVGWKGLINDPFMDDSFKIAHGLELARKLLIDLAEIGLPLSTEALDPISPQYIHDLISWAAIGARTTESQTHREMASGLSSPVGFKNGTDGGLGVAINALQSVQNPHRFLGITQTGKPAVITTRGNPFAHIVLRGGSNKTNYDAKSIAECEQALTAINAPHNIMVDCSHANSHKDFNRQPIVAQDITQQILDGNQSICGLMIESNLHEGNQSIPQDLSQLKYGVSVTDACISWETTEYLLKDIANKLGSNPRTST